MDWKNVICPKCKSLNDYNETIVKTQNVCRCNVCSTYIGCKPYEEVDNPKILETELTFGKYKGEMIKDIDDDKYFWWMYENIRLKGDLKKAIHKTLNIIE